MTEIPFLYYTAKTSSGGNEAVENFIRYIDFDRFTKGFDKKGNTIVALVFEDKMVAGIRCKTEGHAGTVISKIREMINTPPIEDIT
jgi:hypothetical protein